jgi:hypothetical protein
MFVEADDHLDTIKKFTAYAAKKLGLNAVPKLIIHRGDTWRAANNSFGRYEDANKVMH